MLEALKTHRIPSLLANFRIFMNEQQTGDTGQPQELLVNVSKRRTKPTTPITCHLLALVLVTVAWVSDADSMVFAEDGYELEIIKSKRLLLVKKGTEIERRYHIAHGKGGKGTKRRAGDNKTPIGVYRVLEFEQDSKFHYFMQLNYPNMLDAWYGYKNKVISGDEFETILWALNNGRLPPQDTSLGGFIGIHGIGEVNGQKLLVHHQFNWTEGCIALTNEEINELRQYVGIGTRVVVRE